MPSKAMVLVTAHKVLYYSYRLLLYFLFSASLILEDYGIKQNIKPIVDFISELLKTHEETIIQIYKHHDTVDSGKQN